MHHGFRTLTQAIASTSTVRRLSLCCATAAIAGVFAGAAPSAASASPDRPAYAGNADYDSGNQYAVTGPSHRVHRPRQRQASSRRSRGKRVASLGRDLELTPPPRSVTGGVRWSASAGCLNGQLQAVIVQIASFGAVTVNSTCRSRRHNARVGGAHRSHHLTGSAVDFRVRGNVSAAYAYLRSSGSVGGVKHYGGGLFHIDTGPRRSW
jgi:peptidase M15-like protein